MFLGILIGILFSTVTVYAATTYLASNVTYKDTTVEAALDELYLNKKILKFEAISSNSVNGMRAASNTSTLELNKGKYICFCNYSTSSATTNKGVVNTTDSDILTINGCNNIKIIDTKSSTLTGKSVMGYGDAYYMLVSENKTFSCDIDEPTTISCNGSGTANTRIPYNNYISCSQISEQ